jgi:hypothetical protein
LQLMRLRSGLRYRQLPWLLSLGALANVCASIVRDPSGGILCPIPLGKLIRLTFFTVQRKDIPFVRADLVSRDTFEHFTDFLWSETLNNVKPAA